MTNKLKKPLLILASTLLLVGCGDVTTSKDTSSSTQDNTSSSENNFSIPTLSLTLENDVEKLEKTINETIDEFGTAIGAESDVKKAPIKKSSPSSQVDITNKLRDHGLTGSYVYDLYENELNESALKVSAESIGLCYGTIESLLLNGADYVDYTNKCFFNERNTDGFYRSITTFEGRDEVLFEHGNSITVLGKKDGESYSLTLYLVDGEVASFEYNTLKLSFNYYEIIGSKWKEECVRLIEVLDEIDAIPSDPAKIFLNTYLNEDGSVKRAFKPAYDENNPDHVLYESRGSGYFSAEGMYSIFMDKKYDSLTFKWKEPTTIKDGVFMGSRDGWGNCFAEVPEGVTKIEKFTDGSFMNPYYVYLPESIAEVSDEAVKQLGERVEFVFIDSPTHFAFEDKIKAQCSNIEIYHNGEFELIYDLYFPKGVHKTDGASDTHAHSFDKKDADQKHHAHDATCTKREAFFYSCSNCGKSSNYRLFYEGELAPHKLEYSKNGGPLCYKYQYVKRCINDGCGFREITQRHDDHNYVDGVCVDCGLGEAEETLLISKTREDGKFTLEIYKHGSPAVNKGEHVFVIQVIDNTEHAVCDYVAVYRVWDTSNEVNASMFGTVTWYNKGGRDSVRVEIKYPNALENEVIILGCYTWEAR